jgi:hypothetical protein
MRQHDDGIPNVDYATAGPALHESHHLLSVDRVADRILFAPEELPIG